MFLSSDCRTLDFQSVDKNPHMILDLHRLGSRHLVLLLDSGNEALGDLVHDIRDVRATVDGRNRVGKRNLLKPSETVKATSQRGLICSWMIICLA